MISLVRSLVIATFFSFLVPLLFFTGLLGSTMVVSHIPGIAPMGHELTHLILQFLNVFGSGNWVGGILTIAMTCSIVGFLFDGYRVFYHQYLRAVHHHPMQ